MARRTMSERLAILAEHEHSGTSVREACRRYGIQPLQFRRWREQRDRIASIGTRRVSIHSGRTPDFAEFDEELLRYVLGRREKRAIVTVRNLTNFLYRTVPSERHKSFKNMRRYIYRFIARNRLSIRRITRNVILSETELERRANEFLNEVQNIVSADPNTIFVNMDETAVYAETIPRTTIDTTGVINVAASVRGDTSDRVTAALTVCSNGEKLRPMIIFKGSEGGRIARTFQSRNSPYPTEAIYAVQANAWMNEQIMIKWFDQIFFPYTTTAAQEGRNVVLVLDTFKSHQTVEVRRRIRENGIQVLYIPGGLTGQLQPLDVGINGPFKHWLREANASGDISQATPEQRRIQIVFKVLQCWNSLDSEIVMNSFNHMLIRSAEEIDDFDEIE
jgi:hypothetical protein